jgi:hypothetical protein
MEIDTRSLNTSYIFVCNFCMKKLAHFIHVPFLQFKVKLSDYCPHSLGHALLSVTMGDGVIEEKGIYTSILDNAVS